MAAKKKPTKRTKVRVSVDKRLTAATDSNDMRKITRINRALAAGKKAKSKRK